MTVAHADRKLVGSAVVVGGAKAPVTITLRPWSSLTGRLVDDEGKPVEGRVSLEQEAISGQDPTLGVVVGLRGDDARTDGQGRFTIPEETKRDRKSGKIWTHPVVANGRLYLRDQDLIFCYDVKGKK